MSSPIDPKTKNPPKHQLRSTLVGALLGLVLAAHMASYGSWIIDDAGITFAYARNVAEGYGWVAQPGDSPVEGFTNLLWLVLLLPFLAVDLFDPVLTPKVLGFGCAFGAVLLVRRAAHLTDPRLGGWRDIGLLFLVTNPAFAIWCVSGLENGLFALLIATLLTMSSAAARDSTSIALSTAITAGTIAALTAATRPDGLVLAALWPVTVLVTGDRSVRRRLQLATIASAVTIVALGGLTAWRWHEFGDLVPNTFHAKVGDSWDRLLAAGALALTLGVLQVVNRLPQLRSRWLPGIAHAVFAFLALELFAAKGITRCLAGEPGAVVLPIALAAAGARSTTTTTPWVIGTILALFGYQALPLDWMGEWRFGTAFALIATPWITLELGAARSLLTGNGRRFLTIAAGAVGAFVLVRATVRMLEFRQNPTVPMSTVLKLNERIANWATDIDHPGAPPPTLLAADMGGALWHRKLRMMDLAGLCDAEFARLLDDPDGFAQAALARRPTFVELHGHMAGSCGLPNSERFRADYMPIQEQLDPYASNLAGRPTLSGIYVRREHAPPAAVLQQWRRSLGQPR